jgi:hypothetical protein
MKPSLTAACFLALMSAAHAQPARPQPMTSFPLSVSLADHILIYLENGGTHDEGQLLAEQLRAAGNAEMERQQRAAEMTRQSSSSASPTGPSSSVQGSNALNAGPLQDKSISPSHE